MLLNVVNAACERVWAHYSDTSLGMNMHVVMEATLATRDGHAMHL